VSDSSSIGLSRSAFSAKTLDEVILKKHKQININFSSDLLKNIESIISSNSYFE
jgi:hypothetical protein